MSINIINNPEIQMKTIWKITKTAPIVLYESQLKPIYDFMT